MKYIITERQESLLLEFDSKLWIKRRIPYDEIEEEETDDEESEEEEVVHYEGDTDVEEPFSNG